LFYNWYLQAVLPEGDEGVSGFSVIGHIIHLNLKEQLAPHKAVIGAALLLTKGIRTVVNKSQTIDNTYRNFAMELLAGEEDFKVIFTIIIIKRWK
jgi:tRNA (guanine37-N1)-methyltransferase